MEKVKIHQEYLIGATAKNILWNAISTVAGLESWFADKVSASDKIMTFEWSGSEPREAEIVASRLCSFIRFHWIDDDDSHSCFEIKMTQDELTRSFVIEINDSVNKDEVNDMIDVWNLQIKKMRRILGF